MKGAWLPKLRPGGILLLHDVDVRSKEFGVWKVWDELQARGRSWTFHDGPGLGVWQKPPASPLPGFLEQLLSSPDEQNADLAKYYTERAAAMQEKIAQHWRDGTIRDTPFARQTVIQVFYSSDGSHREENSIYARIGHQGWKEVRIELPPWAGAAPLRIDFVSALTIIEIASIRLTKGLATCFAAPTSRDSRVKVEETSSASLIQRPALPLPGWIAIVCRQSSSPRARAVGPGSRLRFSFLKENAATRRLPRFK